MRPVAVEAEYNAKLKAAWYPSPLRHQASQFAASKPDLSRPFAVLLGAPRIVGLRAEARGLPGGLAWRPAAWGWSPLFQIDCSLESTLVTWQPAGGDGTHRRCGSMDLVGLGILLATVAARWPAGAGAD
jgi:hypothetical protein